MLSPKKKRKKDFWVFGYIVSNYMFMFMLIFSFTEFTRLKVSDRKPNTCKTISFNRI